ncbi:zonular occludens toxin domain-containing protein [Neisseria sp. ZJ106]|uniref:Zonular occludens toxin domain-containing protein n=1 Tax=Neisseria lisongii TaxID=2912188 RepID=A0ABY7RIP9_9NEIS|nr:zonular occludens toxin domain-containing protein [Neisseria lisongii]MCF7521964.1 zonular occludens toxin domain-containing protein [Neisseria lisongii]WCL71338.1 zonular occludens toxin domain-containing protein [Neisseria lisongii]WCL72332.1 zonular occludens toxin domain-containing protein [Neisseria lisongii]
MLYLITGVPGSGKTLKMISDLMNRKDLQNRPLYLDGIPEVKGDIIPNQPIPEGESMQTWHKWAPTGAILVIDECQRVFRPRPSGSKVPDYVAELETHRHKGIDIFLLTQHPRLIDINVRSLIGHHCHIGKTNLGVRRMIEWERFGDPQSKTDVQNAVKSVYTLDKNAFGVYKSAEEHTKIKVKRSKAIYILPVAILVVLIGCFYVYKSWKTIEKPTNTAKKIEAQASSPEAVGAVAAPAANDTNASGQYPPQENSLQAPQTEASKPYLSKADYEPRIQGQPHTAPIYDNMNKAVKTMPYPVACVQNGNKCTCYTDQATPIQGFDKKQCLDFVKNGIYNPYLDIAQQLSENSNRQIPVTPVELEPEVYVLGSENPQSSE